MADGTKIEWTDATWNPITGCAVVSPGCTNCYAMKLAGTRLRNHESRKGLTKDTKAGPVWTGEMRFNRQWLDQPLRWSKPRMIFVCAHGDLFAEGVPDLWIDHVFSVMALAPQHTFQVLTKRPQRMREYFAGRRANFGRASEVLHEHISHGLSEAEHQDAVDLLDLFDSMGKTLPNVWLGVSVEDQKRADERIPILLDTPAAIRWISAEPLLGPVDFRNLRRYNPKGAPWIDGLRGLVTRGAYLARSPDECCISTSVTIPGELPSLNWVVAGGESGPNARPMHPDWVRQLRDECAAAGVPFLFKQWGNWTDLSDIEPKPICAEERIFTARGEVVGVGVDHGRKGMVDRDWRERGAAWMGRCSKSYAGRILDGVEHNGFPEVRR
ncbi:hypothetical protein BMJ30_07985 [Sinorhizobium medicae]|uniref:phage Gp37/Gp68 family protein n=1 Tax=Sinorhizobium medicae TaxID=110321 RepID=UPI000C7D957E|nr:phage Gp37/Gp68 family protein [Sinorhizobium medicae]PLU20712.1 hypothetical protein BMJ30_07985 [Sinorhizobium medicae]PLU31015.1 hypothetical protein BMJ27_23430 [Sinorhizobium medicae]